MQHIVTERTIELFREKKIFSSISGENRFAVGDALYFDDNTAIEPYSAILQGAVLVNMGAFSYSWSHLPIDLRRVGRYCSIANGLRVVGGNHPVDFVSTSPFTYDRTFSIFTECMKDNGVDVPTYPSRFMSGDRMAGPVVQDDVWTGGDVTLCRNITLGTGCVVAANSVVTKDVPPYAIVGGNPAKLIRMRFDEGVVRDLLALAWWRFKFSDFAAMRFDDPAQFIRQLEASIAAGSIEEFRPEPFRLAELET